jgi:uridine phosphorylase
MPKVKSELIISPDGTLYHLDLKRSDGIPSNLLLMGSAERVDTVSKHFDTVRFRHENKARPEFRSAFGTYKGISVGAISTGIGTPSMEIVCNELHALFEYDYKRNQWHKPKQPINIIRVGTCGTSLPDIPLGALAVIEYSLGLDNAGLYYPPSPRLRRTSPQQGILKAFQKTKLGKINPCAYVSEATPFVTETLKNIAGSFISGIATTSPGFFASEGRTIGRMNTALSLKEFIKEINDFSFQGLRITSHEMETSILFRIMNEILGYRTGAICVVLDNLKRNEVIGPSLFKKQMNLCIRTALDAIRDLAET